MSIEKTFKGFSQFLNECKSTSISLLKVAMRSKFGVHLPKAESDTCILLGNGPSLKTSLEKHSDFMKEHTLMCVNNFATTEEFEKLKPSYYTMLDPCYWVEEPNEMAKNCLASLREKTTWKLQLLLPIQAKKSKAFNNLCNSNKNINVYYFNYTVFKGFDKIAHSFFRKNMAMPQSQNILVACLFLSINMGFKKLILLGADHTWHQNLHVNEQNQLCLRDTHFYENEQQINYRIFYKDEHNVDVFKMHEIMATMGKVFYGYEVIKKYADSRSVSISNASDISFIDSFNRIKL